MLEQEFTDLIGDSFSQPDPVTKSTVFSLESAPTSQWPHQSLAAELILDITYNYQDDDCMDFYLD